MSLQPDLISRTSPMPSKSLHDNFDDADQFEQFADLEWSQSMFYKDSSTSAQDDTRTSHEKHLLQNQEEFDLHDSKRQETSGEAEKKKPGRKPITNEPTTKRKAQNRAAQRAFRERKENHVKTLENRVAELEQQNNNKSAENQMLKAQIAQLQSGSQGMFATNDKLFTFDCPAPQTTRAQSLEVSPTANDNIPPISACPSLYSSDSSPQTMPEKEFNAATMPNFQRDRSYQESHYSSNDSAIYTHSPSNGESEDKLTPVEPLDPDLTFLFSESFAGQPLQYGFDPMNYRENTLSNSFEVDPPIFDNADTLGLSETYPASSLDFLSLSNQKPGTIEQEIYPSEVSETSLLDQPTDNVKGEPEVGCPEVWRKIVAHPKFASFDLDSLCSEFSKKTTCNGSGPPTWSNKEKDWATFDKHLDEFAERTTSKNSAS